MLWAARGWLRNNQETLPIVTVGKNKIVVDTGVLQR